MITEEQINEYAEAYIKSSVNTSELSDHEVEDVKNDFKSGMKKAIELMQPEWIDIDLDDTETLPLDFDPVICLNEHEEYQILQLQRYGDCISNWEWETQGLKRNSSFPIDYIKRWTYLPEPPKTD
ncbi:hypothetical protein [uncultured Clostridium sp.]|uniref:hypothetical protein n=1 Tax=uncultured Clostridium sp. TaxID=59620 RepID=UPI002605A696|nr:hypothetical protein [uncultured Clostridium sp.]